ncbi:hypothetical protein PVK06_043087 [Gossypium arboreum]|uniref:RNase H type-1 domain-containing protein n=1 Tax=Gossypium arboreum TaxID=29729 RepID=A0ABR0MPK9_GOSAR|nr:hypothetical protein PVK06_043087 [Gossypium arboreum]
MGHKLLPTNVKISSIKQHVNQGCLRCGISDETAIYALKNCSKAREILFHSGIDGIGIIARDCDGLVLRGIVTCKDEHMNVEWDEFNALVEGINLACTNNFKKVIF